MARLSLWSGSGLRQMRRHPMADVRGCPGICGNRRPTHLHTLAPLAETSVAKVRMPVRANDVVVFGGKVAVQATLRSEAGATSIQILRPDGTIEAGIAASASANSRLSESPLELIRVLGRANDQGDIWSAHVNRYRIVRYGVDGAEKARIDRISEWFRPYSVTTPGAPFTAPSDPGVASIHQDAAGLLWVAIVRPPRSFAGMAGGRGSRAERPLSPHMDMNEFLHTTIEVLDPVKGEVLARHEFAEFVRFVNTPGDDVFVFVLRPDALGSLECIVTPLRLDRG